MNTAELKKLAEAATPGQWVANEWASTDSDGAIDVCGTSVISPKEQCGIFTTALEGDDTNDVNFIAAANPATILKLLEINAELAKALKLCAAVCAGETLNKSSLVQALEKSSAALAKAEGGEL